MKLFAFLFSILTTALIAGLFFNWSVAVIPGLARLSDRNYMQAMHAINRAILNPAFLLCFMAPIVLLPLTAWQQYNNGTSFWLMVGASVVYIAGVFIVTMGGNVPLNNALDALDIPAMSDADVSAERLAFEKPWVMFHHIRAAMSVIAMALVALACLLPKK